jgi:hypothetical protein
MAAPAYNTDLATVDLAETTTGWSALGGGAAGLSASPDIAVEGTNCVDKQITNAEKGQVFDNGSALTNGANNHFFIWIAMTTPGLLDTYINRGLSAVIGSSTSAYVQFHLTGSDEFKLAQAFKCWPIRYNNTSSVTRPRRTLTSTPGTSPQVVGAIAKTVATVKGANLGVDGLRRGTGYYITAGDSGTPATFAGAAAIDLASRYGILQSAAGGFALQGRFVVGQTTGGTPTLAYFSDLGAVVVLEDTEHSLSDFTQIIVDHASTNFILTDSTITALGTNNPGRFVVTSADPTVTLTRVAFTGIGVSNFYGNSTLLDCSFRGCGQITASGLADFSGTSVAGFTGATDASALVWNQATDPDTYTDGMSFTKGAGAVHAFEFGTAAPTTMTLRNIDFSDYSGTGTSAALNFLRTSGTTTVNLVNCTGTITAQVTGTHTVLFVIDPVSVTVTVRNTAGTLLSGARVLLMAGDVGPLPYQDSVSITRSGTTATVTHTAHGLSTGQKVYIYGTGDWTYMGVKTITKITDNSYSYTVTGTPADPTGCTATAVIIEGTTSGSGVISDTRSYSGAQDIDGTRSWVRKSSAADDPKYKTAPVSGQISASAGLSLNALMILDE